MQKLKLRCQPQRLRPALWLAVTGCGVAVPLAGSAHLAMVYVSLVATLLAMLALLAWGRLDRLLTADGLPRATLTIASDPAALSLFQAFSESIRDMVASADPIYKELAMERFRRSVEEAKSIAGGRIEFIGNEAWRSAYEKLLRSRGLYRYRSVAYVRTPNYWQDEPGRQSLRLNYEMIANGLFVERLIIIPDAFWPAGERDPVEPIGKWTAEQFRHGVWVSLVRDSLLEGEPDLLTDFGIYGNRAVGYQHVDEHGRTVRFTLSFDFAEVLAAERRWERLKVYARTFGEGLDRPE